MADPSSGDPVYDATSSSTSDYSGLDPGTETIIIVVVVTSFFIVATFLCICYTFPHDFRIQRGPGFRSKFLEGKRHHEAARVDLEEADREFAAQREREEGTMGVTRTGGGRKRSNFMSKLLAVLFMKKTEAQKGERMYVGPVHPGVIITSTPTTSPASAARNENRQTSMVAKLKMLFMTPEGKGKGKETQGNIKKRRSVFGIFFGGLKADVMNAKMGRGGDEESLVGMKEEKREGLAVEVNVPARRSTWGSEAPPAYESLLAEDQQHEGNSHSDRDR
jgi:hypothetical protein